MERALLGVCLREHISNEEIRRRAQHIARRTDEHCHSVRVRFQVAGIAKPLWSAHNEVEIRYQTSSWEPLETSPSAVNSCRPVVDVNRFKL
ncbi:jg5882 [Pararge aegeria aegeria]|uniref:Jg5882 protein n=1 Tax=Pararge aegeria aegeria TaxID=348720 RepID=A0A8S4RGL1_9NEOP|nr:jg5882 [Pararge aegeria aegeria]